MSTDSQIRQLQQQIADLQNNYNVLEDSTNNMWILVSFRSFSSHSSSHSLHDAFVSIDAFVLYLILICCRVLQVSGVLVFLMQVGFAMLENGSLSSKGHTEAVLFKNVVDGIISALAFWLVGYGLAFGDSLDGFCGKTRFALTGEDYDVDDPQANRLAYALFFFQWAFAATAATIVSGALAERCKLQAYFAYSVIITAFVYPIVVHWVWGEGWLSPFGEDRSEYLFYGRKSNNFIDFAGSGVVHTVGGTFAFIGAWIIGPRKVRR